MARRAGRSCSSTPTSPARARGCHIEELSLLGGAPSRVAALDTPGASDSTPTIWRGAIAFARLQRHDTRPPVPQILLWHPGRAPRPLPGGPLPCRARGPCAAPTPRVPLGAFVAGMDLGAQVLGAVWYYNGSNVVEGTGPQWRALRIPLSGGPPFDLADGYIDASCGSLNAFAVSALGVDVAYVVNENACDTRPGSPDYETSKLVPAGISLASGAGYVGALSIDGADTYWLRVAPRRAGLSADYADYCRPGVTSCMLVRSTGVLQ